MEYIKLGDTGIDVSRLCFGGLIIGPLQANLSIEKGADVIVKAFEMGVNFIDTAELYGTYLHIREALKRFKEKVVIATKSYAYDKAGAKESLEKAREGLGVDTIDIFLLHEQESELTLSGHREALEYFIEQKEKGIIKAVGVSTHNIQVVKACSKMPEIDVIHPIVNKNGIGIGDGTIDEMLCAIKVAYDLGKGIYSMKPLGGGNLLNSYDDCIKFVLDIPYIHSIALGMQTIEEVIMNVKVFENESVPKEITDILLDKQRNLHIDYWCECCSRCIERCGQKALNIVNEKISVNNEKCVLCGYCASVCPVFAIKVY